jgi:hypothetical protein
MGDTDVQFQALSDEGYSVPKAQLLFKPSGEDVYHLLGDADDVNVEITVEETERYSNIGGTRRLAKTIINQVDATLNMTLVQLSDLNRALSLLGEVTYDTQTADTGLTLSLTAPEHDGTVYALGKYDVSNVVVTDDAGTPVDYDLDTHYKLDAKTGKLQLISMPTGASGNVEVTFDCAEVVADDKLTKIGIASKTENRGEVIVRGTNTVGPVLELTLHDVQLRPDGERNYISETDLDTIDVVGRIFADTSKPTGFQLGQERRIIPAS